MCTHTHAFVHAEGVNVFEGEALQYLFDACALAPMPPSMQRISMFYEGEALEYLFDSCDTHAFFFAEGFNIFEGEALEYLFDACALTPLLRV